MQQPFPDVMRTSLGVSEAERRRQEQNRKAIELAKQYEQRRQAGRQAEFRIWWETTTPENRLAAVRAGHVKLNLPHPPEKKRRKKKRTAKKNGRAPVEYIEDSGAALSAAVFGAHLRLA